MSEKINFPTDDFNQPLCPVIHTAWEWDDNDERQKVRRPCGELVDLIVTCSVPLEIGIELSALACGVDANSSCWKVECQRGHVLAVSDSDDGGAEAFTWDQVFGTLKDSKSAGGHD